MDQFKQSEKLRHVKYEIRGPLEQHARDMERAGEKLIKLNIGNLAPWGFDAPTEVMQDMITNLQNAQGYTESKGIFPARKAIMQYYQLKKFANLDIEDIFLGNGVSELCMMCMQALMNPGDEVLIPSPDYPQWSAACTFSGGTPVYYTCDEKNGWNPDLDDMKKKITPRTKAILVINPNNPTGAVYDTQILLEIAEVARANNLIIFSDEIYDHLLYDDVQFTSMATLAPDLFVVTLNGLSKSHRVTGFRAGWMVFSGNKELGRDYIKGINLLASLRICANAPGQYIIQTCIGGYQSMDEFLVPGGRLYEQRNFTYKRLNEIPGMSVTKPMGAFYAFPKLDVRKIGFKTDDDFAMQLVNEEKVLVVPGGGFNWRGNDHFRIVTLPNERILEDAFARIERFVTKRV